MTNPTDLNRELAELLKWKFNGNTISRDLFMPAHPTAFSILTRFDPLHDDAQCFGKLFDIALDKCVDISCMELPSGAIQYVLITADWSYQEIGKDKREAFLKALVKLLRDQP